MIILASQSPRRAELLSQLQVPFIQSAVNIDETVWRDEAPEAHVTRLAQTKAQVGRERAERDLPVLGSDTIVVAANQILGKPSDFAHFSEMMKLLSAITHQVMTAVSITDGHKQRSALVKTDVTFKPLTDSEIAWYWDTCEPCDKAGGYGIQGLGGQFVTRINGSYSAVVGLPLFETAELLKEMEINLK